MTPKQLHQKNTPFAVMMYWVGYKSDADQRKKVYEMIFMRSKKLNGKEHFFLAYEKLERSEVNFVKEKLPKIIENEDGAVYEFNDFKKHYDKIIENQK
jgi:hypothetical protein